MAYAAADKRGGRGFTLVELMIALVVLAIVTLTAAPSFNGFIANQRVKTSAHGLFQNLNYARSEAIRRNGEVYVRMFEDSGVSVWVVTPHESGEEPAGWELADCLGSDALAEDCLRVYQASDQLTITGPAQVAFTRNGRAADATDPYDLCDSDGSAAVTRRIIRVGLTGMPNIALDGGCAS